MGFLGFRAGMVCMQSSTMHIRDCEVAVYVR
jgi:hypothetical protein